MPAIKIDYLNHLHQNALRHFHLKSSSKCSSTFSSEIKSQDIKLTVSGTNCRTNGTTL